MHTLYKLTLLKQDLFFMSQEDLGLIFSVFSKLQKQTAKKCLEVLRHYLNFQTCKWKQSRTFYIPLKWLLELLVQQHYCIKFENATGCQPKEQYDKTSALIASSKAIYWWPFGNSWEYTLLQSSISHLGYAA